MSAMQQVRNEQQLTEASPVDSIWRIGLAVDHPDAAVPARWQGVNLLGLALMELRCPSSPFFGIEAALHGL